jgi:hypothetical protein
MNAAIPAPKERLGSRGTIADAVVKGLQRIAEATLVERLGSLLHQHRRIPGARLGGRNARNTEHQQADDD